MPGNIWVFLVCRKCLYGSAGQGLHLFMLVVQCCILSGLVRPEASILADQSGLTGH